MKYVLTILLTGLTVLAYGQTLTDVDRRLRLLEARVPFEHDTTGFSSLPKFDYFCDNENQNTSDYYHVVDLNNDGLKDLIYSGPCMPYGQTGIFLNSGVSFRKIHNYPGEIVSIDKRPSKTIINILKVPCCCDHYTEYIEVTVDDSSNVTKHIITFTKNTKLTLGSKLRAVTVVGTIRTSPVIDDVAKKDDCRDVIIRGNQLIRLTKFSNIIQLSRAGSWWLVLYPETKERSWIGWMRFNN